MTKILHVVSGATAGETYVEKTIAGADVWVRFDIYALDSASAITPFLLVTAGGSAIGGFTAGGSGGTYGFSGYNASIETNSEELRPGRWYRVDVHIVPGNPIVEERFIAGRDQGETSTGNVPGPIGALRFGDLDGGGGTWEFYIRNIKVGSTRGDDDIWTTDLTDPIGTVFDDVVMAASETVEIVDEETLSEVGRVLIALDAARLDWVPEWTRLDDIENLVSGFDIHRGKQTEEDTTDTSTATVYLNDRWGYFDPQNPSSPFAGYLGKQIMLQVQNPVTGNWIQQTRMWIDHVDFDLNPATSEGVSILSNVQLQCIDIFGLLNRLQMDVSEDAGNRVFGNTPPHGSEGIIFYEDSSPGDGSGFDNRIIQILDDCAVTPDWYVVFTGNIDLLEAVADVGDSPLMLLQQAVDAEMPGAGNQYSDKVGRYCAHGRGARFDPDGVSDSAGAGAWNFRRWKAGDGAAIQLDPDRAQIRPPLGWSYSEARVRNVGYAYPKGTGEPAKTAQVFAVPGVDPFDRRVWSAENLLVKAGTTTGNTGLEEALAYATFWATVLSEPLTRPEQVTFKSIDTAHSQAAVIWALMLNADISDIIDLEHGYAGGVGLSDEFFIEGSDMTVRPLNADMDMVEVTFNISPAAYYEDPMGLLGGT